VMGGIAAAAGDSNMRAAAPAAAEGKGARVPTELLARRARLVSEFVAAIAEGTAETGLVLLLAAIFCSFFAAIFSKLFALLAAS
jgi:hypothetical protein